MLEPEQKEDIVYYSSLTLFSLASIVVVVYILLGTYLLANIALAMYSIAFTAVCLFSIRKLFVAKYYSEKLNAMECPTSASLEEREAFINNQLKLKKMIKATKIREIIKMILSGLIAGFTIVVLILF